MKVPYNYLPMQFSRPENIFEDWKKVIQSSEFTLGPFVENFEHQFAKFIGARHVIGTNNGTDALILGLKSLGIGLGDEVLTVPTTFYATIGAIVAVGARPVFVDIDDRYQMDVRLIEQAVTAKTKAILPVHWGGASPYLTDIMRIAKSYGLKVLEDACMAPGGRDNGKHAGTTGHVSAWSMHPLKPLNVMGDGGMVSTDDDGLASWMRMYRNHGMRDRDHNSLWGVNMRLQPLQAVVAGHVLATVDETVAIRNSNADFLDTNLRALHPYVIVPPRPVGYRETYSLYMLRCKRRDELVKHLTRKEIEVKIHYPVPLHLQEASRVWGYKLGDFPIAESYASEIITLPVHQYLFAEQLRFMVSAIIDFYN